MILIPNSCSFSSMIDRLQSVWAKRPGGLLKKRAFLVLDAFRCQCMSAIKKKLESNKTDLTIIPDGMMKIQQPLDVTVNKPVKDSTSLVEHVAGGRPAHVYVRRPHANANAAKMDRTSAAGT